MDKQEIISTIQDMENMLFDLEGIQSRIPLDELHAPIHQNLNAITYLFENNMQRLNEELNKLGK